LLKSSKKFANCYEKCEVVEVSFWDIKVKTCYVSILKEDNRTPWF
jgi:hypothetical protein